MKLCVCVCVVLSLINLHEIKMVYENYSDIYQAHCQYSNPVVCILSIHIHLYIDMSSGVIYPSLSLPSLSLSLSPPPPSASITNGDTVLKYR